MVQKFFKYLKSTKISDRLMVAVACIALILSVITYKIITEESNMMSSNTSKIMWIILCDLIVVLALCVLVTRKFLKIWGAQDSSSKSSLHHRIVLTFSLVAAVPTVLISIFSTYFFNYGLQSWFDQKISKVLDQSIIVARSYISEHTLQLKETTILVADDLSNMYYDLVRDPQLFSKTLSAEAEIRSLSEAIVFQRGTNTILAQTALSFSLSFSTIPMTLIERASKGDVVQVHSDPKKIRMLIKLKEYDDTYLLVGRLIDSKVIEHIDETNGAAEQYYRLRNNMSHIQIMFSIAFIFVALLLFLASISWGSVFATKIIKPIKKLVSATEKVQKGDLSVQIPEDSLSSDEISLLTRAFNRMIKQIDHQQKDLVIAQRALAWSDVARRVAHEIKNPLTPIQLSAERLLKKFENEVGDKIAFRRYIDTIIRHNNDIKTIVSEFVNFARLPTPIFTQGEIVSAISDVVESRKSINEKITYNFKTSSEKIDLVFDQKQIRQVMINLLKNAEESLEETKAPAIDVILSASHESVEIAVSDNGHGFNSELLPIATEAYVGKRTKGMGLGLAIVKKIVQDHSGTISIKNNEQGGALINLVFDLAELSSKLK
jgi:two-component system nitrogen regulation sensor histidine kinase NtrY